jgi:hypothetical protein
MNMKRKKPGQTLIFDVDTYINTTQIFIINIKKYGTNICHQYIKKIWDTYLSMMLKITASMYEVVGTDHIYHYLLCFKMIENIIFKHIITIILLHIVGRFIICCELYSLQILTRVK